MFVRFSPKDTLNGDLGSGPVFKFKDPMGVVNSVSAGSGKVL